MSDIKHVGRQRADRHGEPMVNIILSGLFTAVTGVCAWINIPLFFTPIPINLALIGPMTAGLMLGSRHGALSQIIYILLGTVGLPIFAGFTGGIGVLAGPTGGFIVGYVFCAFICGLPYKKKFLLPLLGLLACHILGLLWFVFSTGNSFVSALVICVIPFLPGDILKIILSLFMHRKLALTIQITKPPAR